MPVIRIYVPNSFENYNHLVVCSETGLAAAVDPFDADLLLLTSQQHQVKINQIWITHEHGDHIRHVDPLKALTDATVYAPISCQGRLEADHWLAHDQRFTLGQLTIQHWLTPGHTPGHGIYLQQNTDKPWAIFGDTLFNAGVGNVRSGNVTDLYHTVQMLKQRLSDDTEVFTGHDYIGTNIAFTLAQNAENASAKRLQDKVNTQTPETRLTTTWGLEKQINLFLQAPNLEAFTSLRQRRDQW